MTNLQFPNYDEIIQYLKNHGCTSDALHGNEYLREQEIDKTIAKIFANKSMNQNGINLKIQLTMIDLGKKIGLPPFAMQGIGMNLSKALLDCANGIPVEIKNQS